MIKNLLNPLLCTLFWHQFDNSELVHGSGHVRCKHCSAVWYVDARAHTMEPVAEGAV